MLDPMIWIEMMRGGHCSPRCSMQCEEEEQSEV